VAPLFDSFIEQIHRHAAAGSAVAGSVVRAK
jgi:hypothetical protein